MHPNVLSSIIYNCQDMEASKVSIKRWMDKDVLCVHVCVCVCVCVDTMYIDKLVNITENKQLWYREQISRLSVGVGAA